MSKLDELIRELCPDGVEWRKFDDVCQFVRGVTYNKSQEAKVPSDTNIAVLRANNITLTSNRLNYDDVKMVLGTVKVKETQRLHKGDILMCAGSGSKEHIGKVAFIDSDMKYIFGGFMGVVRCKDIIEPRYMFHVLTSRYFSKHLEIAINSATINNINGQVMSSFEFPVPPLEVQREIVRILDNFSEATQRLEEELRAELTARKQQFSYYRSKLLEQPKNMAQMVSLSELGKWSGGKTPSMANKDYWENGTTPWISSKDMKAAILEDTEDHITGTAVNEAGMTIFPEGIIAIVTRSGILKHTFPVAYVPFKATVNQDIKALVVKDGISSKYVFHAIQAYAEDIRVKTKKQGGTVDSLDFQKVLDYKIPIPAIEVQNRLVDVLDNFQAICADLKIGLPAEIEAREKQYEYYRDRLLSFDLSNTPPETLIQR